ncbi:MAG: MBL fold metallo-hydrolase [Euryarchaeota archaeon]|nr:MBL fold metallo-hydrolase [Euryarchaeota archaeon]
MPFERLPWDPNTYYTDVHMFGEREFGSVYLIDDERVALVETGTSNDADAILAAVHDFGYNPEDVDALVVSHIHLDHAGGAGFLLDAMRNATVYVHERGHKHLVDPSRLLASATDALQDMAESFGTMRPIRPDRLVAVRDGDTLDLGGRVLTFHHTPGHAPHELIVTDAKNRCIYTGDEAGLWFPRDNLLMPVTPAPSFDLTNNLASFETMLAFEPRALLFSHFGPHTEPRAAIETQRERYELWSAFVRERYKAKDEEAMVEELFGRYGKGATFYSREFLHRRIRNSVHGLVVYHRRLEHAAPGR